MHKITVSGIELGLDNGMEVIHMGGPYVCDVWMSGELIIKDALSENFVYDSFRKRLFYIQYHKVNHYQYFTINFYQLESRLTFEFIREFEMVFIKSLLNDHKLEILNAFYDRALCSKAIFNLDDEDFVMVKA